MGFIKGMVDQKAYQKIEIKPEKFLNISKHIQGDVKQKYVDLLKQYKDVFTWSHNDIKGIYSPILWATSD